MSTEDFYKALTVDVIRPLLMVIMAGVCIAFVIAKRSKQQVNNFWENLNK